MTKLKRCKHNRAHIALEFVKTSAFGLIVNDFMYKTGELTQLYQNGGFIIFYISTAQYFERYFHFFFEVYDLVNTQGLDWHCVVYILHYRMFQNFVINMQPINLTIFLDQRGPTRFDLQAIVQKRDNSRVTSNKIMY